jgi:hypothetical protein
MIDKSGEYWHLHFSEQCEDNPAEILKLVEKLFSELQELDSNPNSMTGQTWFIRSAPFIQRATEFDTGRRVAHLYCRLSSRPVK